jgi:hypothetical protein
MRLLPLKLVAISVLVVASVSFWFVKVEPLRQNRAFYYRTRAALHSLLDRRPAGVDVKYWQNWVGWTMNAHANTVSFYPKIPQADMDQFERELGQKILGQPDVQTLEWIWDELARLVPNGKKYSDDWRPTSPTRITPFEQEPLMSLPPPQ